VNKEYQKFGRENFEKGTALLTATGANQQGDAFRYLWEAYENFLDGLPVPASTMREKNNAFEDFLVKRELAAHFIEGTFGLPEAGLLADLQPRIFHEQTFQRTGEKRTDEHDAYASDYDRLRSGLGPKKPIARLLNLLYVVRNNLQHGQKVLPNEWPAMKQRNLQIFHLVAPVQRRLVLRLFETVWADGVFVYGTLRPASTRFNLIRDLAQTKGDKYFVSGKLYDLGDHPGLVLGAGDRVPGEILHNDRLHELLRRVDEIEGSDFIRRLYWTTPAVDSDESALTWIYEYRGKTSGIRRCRGGIWPKSVDITA
jgi:gamma-glutamylcyclotransferase (GGCT)/AIG2-like uncharacterized protein YtfP